jgi:hypothetical protein
MGGPAQDLLDGRAYEIRLCRNRASCSGASTKVSIALALLVVSDPAENIREKNTGRGDSEQQANGLHGQFCRDVDEKVTLAVDPLEQHTHPPAEFALEVAH